MLMTVEAGGEHAPLLPIWSEIVLSGVVLLHPVLLLVVLILIFTTTIRLPFGLLGIVVLFLVPVAGPLLVLLWNYLESRSQDSAA